MRFLRLPSFYGWYVVAAIFFVSMTAIGSRQAFGLFVNPWSKEFGVSVATISAISSVGWVINGLAQPVVGRLTDRYGGRVTMGTSLLVLGVGTVILSVSPNIWVLGFIHAAVISFAVGGVMFTPSTTVIARWFRRKRGTAMGILAAGGSFGGILGVPFLAYLLLLTDWRLTWGIVAAVMLLIGLPLLLVVVRNDPWQLGLQPDGETAEEAGRAGPPRLGPLTAEHWPQCFRSAPLWLLGMSYVVCGITTAMVATHFVPYAENEGISASTAALAFGLLSAMNLMGVIGAGWLSDRMPRKNILTAIYWTRGVGFLLLAFLPAGVGIWAFAAVAGISWLATVPLTSALASEIYGVKNMGTIVGILTMAHQFGGAAAVFLAGVSFDVLGSYTPAFAGAAATLAVAGVTASLVQERLTSARYVGVVPAAAEA